jgi:hypothetical protein
MVVAFGVSAAQPQPRAHVYALRGLLNIFSLGMDTLAEELKGQDVYATVDSYLEWQTLADRAAAEYKAGKEAPIILIGHSAITRPPLPKKGMAPMLAPLRLFRSKAAQDKTPTIPRHPRTSRQPARNHFRYRIDTRWIGSLSGDGCFASDRLTRAAESGGMSFI